MSTGRASGGLVSGPDPKDMAGQDAGVARTPGSFGAGAAGGLTPGPVLREQVALACRVLALEGYADLTLGHVSVRGPEPDTISIKRKGVALDEVEPEDVVEVGLDRVPRGGATAADLHLETVLHTEVYRARPDVGAVVHGHPPYATALSATEARLELLTHDSVLFAEGVGRFDESAELIIQPEQGRAVAQALGRCRALLLRNHGVLVVGRDAPWAVLAAVTLERAIRLQSIAGSLGSLRPIPADWAERLQSQKYGDRLVEEYWASWIRRVQRARDSRLEPRISSEG